TNGDIIDAQTPDLEGEEAFMRILSWKTGNFEIFPPEQDRPRRIHTAYQALLLNTAHAIDEAEAETEIPPSPADGPAQPPEPALDTQFFRKSGFGRIRGVEFALNLPLDTSVPIQKWGLENPDALASWTRNMIGAFQQIADKFQFGPIQQVDARGLQRNLR